MIKLIFLPLFNAGYKRSLTVIDFFPLNNSICTFLFVFLCTYVLYIIYTRSNRNLNKAKDDVQALLCGKKKKCSTVSWCKMRNKFIGAYE